MTVLLAVSGPACMASGRTADELPPLDEPPPINVPPTPTDPQPTDPEPELIFEPGPPVLPRLTTTQYRNTLEDIFGLTLPEISLEPDTNPYLFYNIGATSTSLSEVGAQKYADAATAVLDAALPGRVEQLLGCTPQAPGDRCVSDYIARIGRRLFRRPLTAEDLARWISVSRDAADGDAVQGVRIVLYGMLQSPFFLYRLEVGELDRDDPSRRRYTSFEMAERLSFLIWNAGPDDALLDAAAQNELITDEGIRRHAMRLLDSPRAQIAVQDFFAQYFDLNRLDGLERDPAQYPLYSEDLIEAMRSEVRLLVQDFVFRQDADIRQIFSTRRTFVNSDLAALYGIEAPGASKIAFVPVVLPEDGPRAGLLTLGAFLAMNAHPTETSPTLRGRYVRERVLCQKVPDPPANVDTSIPPETSEARTLRERLEQHRANPACKPCHEFIDPPGYLFENFDSIGAYRTEVNGVPLDTSGELDDKPLADARDLAEALRDEPRIAACVVKQLYRHASARLDEKSEKKALADLQIEFGEGGYRFKNLLVELALSEGFRTLRADF